MEVTKENKVYLYGASGHARVIMDSLRASGYEIEALVDDNLELTELDMLPILHESRGLSPFIISIGKNDTRRKVAEKLTTEGATFERAIHPNAVLSPSTKIGEGTVVMAGALINAFSQIGCHCIINTGASIDHECQLEDYVHVSPHATLCGNVSVGEGTWIGAGSTIIQGINIGKWCVIGAGSVVTKDIPDGYLAVGNRCKLIKLINDNLL